MNILFLPPVLEADTDVVHLSRRITGKWFSKGGREVRLAVELNFLALGELQESGDAFSYPAILPTY